MPEGPWACGGQLATCRIDPASCQLAATFCPGARTERRGGGGLVRGLLGGSTSPAAGFTDSESVPEMPGSRITTHEEAEHAGCATISRQAPQVVGPTGNR